jgi:hypothetical protein
MAREGEHGEMDDNSDKTTPAVVREGNEGEPRGTLQREMMMIRISDGKFPRKQ